VSEILPTSAHLRELERLLQEDFPTSLILTPVIPPSAPEEAAPAETVPSAPIDAIEE
jgi:hypothetical protein